MVRKYKPKPGHKQYKKYDPQVIEKAIKELRNGNGTLRKIAKKYEITTSVLSRHSRNMHCHTVGAQTTFSFEREEHIIKYMNACAPCEYYVTPWDIRLLIQFYLDKRPIISKKKLINNLPGQDLATNILKRHEDAISQRIIQNMKNNSSITVEVILSYFHELKISTAEILPDNIVCYKDILLVDDIDKNVADETKTNDIFVMTAASASGEMLQPYVIYEEQNYYEIPKRTMSKQPYPRLSAHVFEDWFESIILPYYEGRPGKKCLISGYFSSRISIDLLEICKEHNIDFVFLPHNSSNLTHPLDTLSQQIQSQWNHLLFQSKVEGKLSKNLKRCFRTILQELSNSATEKISQEFKKTGINPINPSEVLKQLPDYNETTIENVDEDFEYKEFIQNNDIDLVQVKEEMGWSDDNYDEDIASTDDQITPFKAKGKGKKSGDNKTQWKKTESQLNLMAFDLKLSPVDFQEEHLITQDDYYINEDTTVDHITEHNTNESNAKFPKKNHSTQINKGNTSYINENEIHCTQKNETFTKPKKKKKQSKASNLDEEIVLVDSEKDETDDIRNMIEIDPLLNCRNCTNLQTTLSTTDSSAGTTSTEGPCKNGACNTHTGLLEAILSSVTRQEKLQERTVQAMEAQTRALDIIARALEGWGSENNTNAKGC